MSTTTLITGRLVAGHPLRQQAVTDQITKAPKLDASGAPRHETFFAVAIPKTEPDWKLSPWGQQFVAAAVEGWTGGEHLSPTFAWKVIDGDSQIPNKAGKRPCDKEGYPGHWVVSCSTGIPVACFNAGQWGAMEALQDPNLIKCGDYCRANLIVRANKPSQTAGIYVNPNAFELSRAGELIVSDSAPDAMAIFGGGA
jgi:hypothetical protein